MKLSFNKKGDIASLIYAVVAIAVLGILFLFSNHVTDKMYDKFDVYFNSTTDYNESEARTALSDISDVNNSIWDYAFLFLTVGLFFVLAVSAYSTKISPIFFWIYAILSLVVLGIAVTLSSLWQVMAQNDELSGTIARFPITDTILGTYYPTIIAAFAILIMVLLFGKLPNQSGGEV